VGVFTRTHFFLSHLVELFSEDEAHVDAWLYFPGFKVGHLYSISTIWWH
jgi:hypothetical protein